MGKLSHVNEQGAASMVDVSGKEQTLRKASARARVTMAAETAELIRAGAAAKGPVLETARIAGIGAAKKTGELIPLCHPLGLDHVAVEFDWDGDTLLITASTVCRGATGVEMEAMTAASVAALTVYDMCKAVDRAMSLGPVELMHKSGGKSGEWRREG